MSTILNPRWSDETKSIVICEMDGRNVSVPAIVGNAVYDDIISEGIAIQGPEVTPPTESDFSSAIQLAIDKEAKGRGYADGVAFAGYATSTVPSWASEAKIFISWRDQVWLYAYNELGKVVRGERLLPTVESMVKELPKINWTQGD